MQNLQQSTNDVQSYNPFAAPGHQDLVTGPRASYSNIKPVLLTLLFAGSVTGVSFTAPGKLLGIRSGFEVALILGVGLVISTFVAGLRQGFRDAIAVTQFMNLSTWLAMWFVAYAGIVFVGRSSLSWGETQVFIWICLGGSITVVAPTWLGSLFHLKKRERVPKTTVDEPA